MDRLDGSEAAPERLLAETAASPALEQRFAAGCSDFAVTLRCLEGVSAQAARVLETGENVQHLFGLLTALDHLVTEAGQRSATLGAVLQCRDCQGSA